MAIVELLAVITLTALTLKILLQWTYGGGTLKDIPGPRGLPFFGNAFQFRTHQPQISMMNWSERFGKVFKFKLLGNRFVCINDLEMIKEMFASEACSSRMSTYRLKEIVLHNAKDIIHDPYSEEWNERKKMVTRSLNSYGTRRLKIEDITLESIGDLHQEILKESKTFTESLDMKPILHRCVTGIISTLMYGRQFTKAELYELLSLDKYLLRMLDSSGIISLLEFFPWMRYLPLKAIQEPIEAITKLRNWVLKMSNESQQDGERKNSIYESISNQVNKATNEKLSQEEIFGINIDIMSAGFSTSSVTLNGLILVLINYPDIQDKMHQEIMNVIGKEQPEILHQQHMPYVKAVLEEHLRYSSIVPVGVPHLTSEDTLIGNTYFPKGIILFPNLWNIHHDENIFENPWEFRPERFLQENGSLCPSSDPVRKHFLPFGAGKRICPGEGLARNRIFLIMACLLQRYRFVPEDESNIPDCDPRETSGSLLLEAAPFKVKVEMRF